MYSDEKWSKIVLKLCGVNTARYLKCSPGRIATFNPGNTFVIVVSSHFLPVLSKISSKPGILIRELYPLSQNLVWESLVL